MGRAFVRNAARSAVRISGRRCGRTFVSASGYWAAILVLRQAGLTLALGIGVNSALFSVMYAVLFARLPARRAAKVDPIVALNCE
jgi:hypothetical protein